MRVSSDKTSSRHAILALLSLAVALAATPAAAADTTAGSTIVPVNTPRSYPDGRPAAHFRLEAHDQGVVLRHGDGPGQCDRLGARDIWVFQAGDTYYLHYDGAGPRGWLACLATSPDLVQWTKKGGGVGFRSAGRRRFRPQLPTA